MLYNKVKFRNLLNYKNKVGKKDSLITFMVYNITVQKWIDELYHQLEKCKLMKNAYKRKEVNDRLFGLISFLKENYSDTNQKIHAICLLNEELYFMIIPRKFRFKLEEYGIRNMSYYRDDFYRIDILEDIFYNIDYKHYVKLTPKDMVYSIGTEWKEKQMLKKAIHTKKELEYELNNIRLGKTHGIIYGKNMLLKKLDILPKWNIINENLNRKELIDKFEKLEFETNNKLLSIIFEMIEKADDKLIIGKRDMVEALNNFMVKDVFCVSSKMKELMNLAEKECYNFKVTKIGSLENGDPASVIGQCYGGYVGIKYY